MIKTEQKITYMFIKILEMFLPTRLLGPTRLLIFEKKNPTYMVIRAPRLLGTSEYVSFCWPS